MKRSRSPSFEGVAWGRRPGPILILSAFPPELAPLRSSLRRSSIGASEVTCLAAGIGAIEAALGAARELTARRRRPRLVLFVGTAGSYSSTPALGSVVVARRIRLVSTAVARGDGYLPPPMPVNTATDASLRQALRRASPSTVLIADVATPLAITKKARLGQLLFAQTGAVAENLEAFAVGRACEREGIPFGAVLGISNRVGPQAHSQWLSHRSRATQAACASVAAFLSKLVS